MSDSEHVDSDTRPESLINQKTRSDYWFDDGNVVLQAENILFRVHKSILSRHSQVFKDMFAIPHAPSQENEYIEGCPVIPVSDTAPDMSNIISLFYDPKRTLGFGGTLPPGLLRSMLRLGRKYEIADFEEEALECLHNSYPTTLFGWDEDMNDGKRMDLGLFADVIISIAHEFRMFTILPAAYIQYLKSWNIDGLVGDANLPEKARHHCILGCARILEFVKKRNVDALCPPLVLPTKKCSGGSRCEANKWKAINSLPVWRFEDEEDCFGIFDSRQSLSAEAEDLCPQCRSAAKKLTIKVREEFWSILPTFFDLPAWADLKDEL